MALINPAALLLLVCVLILRVNSSVGDKASTSHNNNSHENGTPGHASDPIPELKVAKFDFAYVAGPLTIIVWILIASFAKLGKCWRQM